MRIQEPTLRTLAATGSVRELVAQRVKSGGDGWELCQIIGLRLLNTWCKSAAG
jgi:hypothetical protein